MPGTEAVEPRAAIVPVPPEPVIDVMQVVGRSEADVAALLGEPTSCEQVHRARWCRYGPDQDEVMFMAGKADMVTVHGMDAVAFDAQALRALGLEPSAPDHADEYAIRWESLPDLEEVSVFPEPDGSIDYAYVKVGAH